MAVAEAVITQDIVLLMLVRAVEATAVTVTVMVTAMVVVVTVM